VAGYFVGAEDVHYIAVNAQQEAAANAVVFHEYTHSMTDHAIGVAPAWLNEGLAEFYETFQSADDGGSAMVGTPNRENLQLLQSATLIPIAQLVTVTPESPVYNQGERRDLFYAESWRWCTTSRSAMLSGPHSSTDISRPCARTAQGPTCFLRTFGSDVPAIERELQAYIRSLSLKAVRVDVDTGTVGRTDSGFEPIAEDDAAGYLGDMLARLNRTADARAYLQKLVDANRDAGRALAALGALEIRDGRAEVGVPLLERAAALSPDEASVQAAYGRALVTRAEFGGADEDALYERASLVLSRALDLNPADVPTAVMFAAVEMSRDGDTAKAVALLQRVVSDVPGRENYRLMLARALAAEGDYDGATRLLNDLAVRGSTPAMRDAAREVREDVAAAASGSPGLGRR